MAIRSERTTEVVFLRTPVPPLSDAARAAPSGCSRRPMAGCASTAARCSAHGALPIPTWR